jgi:Rod binding domain-containing protein
MTNIAGLPLVSASTGIAPGNAPSAVPPARNKDGRAAEAATQFETLLISEMLKSARESGSSGWLGAGEEDQAGDSAMEIAEEHLAGMMAANGGLGIASVIRAGLEKANR